MGDTTQTRYLDDDEIEAFVGELDKNNNGHIEYEEVEHRLDLVHDEIAPKVQPHNLHHEGKDDEARHRFLRSMMGPEEQRVSRGEFASRGQSFIRTCTVTVALVSMRQAPARIGLMLLSAHN